jgi:DNA-binding CsgD family transcriptional regulator/PAS domain-containing protein
VAIDTTKLSDLIDAIYAAGTGARSWHDVVTEVARAFGEQGGILYEFDARLRQSQVLGSTPVDTAMIAQYEQYYGSIDTLHHRVVREPTLEINATHNLIRDSDLERSEFYSDYFRHLDFFYAMGSIVRRHAGRTTVFGVQRSRRRGHFDAREFKTMEMLTRHVDRSLRIADLLRSVGKPASSAAGKGLVLLDAGGNVLFANEPALRLLGLAQITIEARQLRASGTTGNRLDLMLEGLRQAAAAARVPADALDIELESGARLSLLATGQSNAAAVAGSERFISLAVELHDRPTSRAAELRRRYRLTAAEAALAIAVADGQTLRDIAEAGRLSVNTLRVQLQSVFAKTGCHRQSELVRLVLRLPAG